VAFDDAHPFRRFLSPPFQIQSAGDRWFPNLSNYLRELYQVPGVAETVNLVKRHYYMSMTAINPTLIVPRGPLLDFAAPHDRGRLPRG
jgi:glutathionyl-hydroquinone reductase